MWLSTVTADRRWGWDGRRWTPLRSERLKSPPAPQNVRVSHLIGLLILDLVGFAPGTILTSVLAATVLLAIDARGLVTLNGLIKWKRMNFRLKLLVALLEIVLFQFLVAVYLAQRLFGVAKGVFGPASVGRPNPLPHESDAATEFDEATSSAPLDADGIQRALDTVLSEARNRLPLDLLDKVQTIVSRIADILPAYRASGLDPHDRFVVERTAEDYLPSALRSYLKLPVAYRSTPLPDAGGKTASEVLSDQLDLLIERMSKVVDATYRKDLEALLVHGRFLASKFARSGLGLNS